MPSTLRQKASFLAFATLGALALAACKNTTSVAGAGGAGATSTGSGGAGGSGGSGGAIYRADKVDLLFAIDNSRSTAGSAASASEKQTILSLSLADLITGLTNPPCLDESGNYVSQPGALATCPQGSARQVQPVTDIHIGVVSSSLGGHGSDACGTTSAGKASNNDKAHLLTRTAVDSNAVVPTYQGMGFLAWDPAQTLLPPGEDSPTTLLKNFRDIVLGVGQIGCGYESQLESWYRFLVDPDPVETVTLDADGSIVLVGTDQILLEQRKAFLRPDSMLVIVSLSDENDCSIREEGQFYFAAQQKSSNGSPFHLPRPRAVCETEPGDPCCFSCGQAGPQDEEGTDLCEPDPTCTDSNGALLYLDELGDNINLRCFDQKRRFGIDFLYPPDRYVNALTQPGVPDRSGQIVPNPIFGEIDPDAGVTRVRDPGLVLFAGILGVPWQDIAKNPADLKQGFKTSSELTQLDANGHTTWDIILGDPASDVKPLDPFMNESVDPRSGKNPVTGASITEAGMVNAINGHEYTIPKRDDLQYTCIMPLPLPIDCSQPLSGGCDCTDAVNDNPLCEEGASGGNTLQTRSKAYPGLRQLSVLKGVGEQAVIGSICATQITDPTLPDYAYRPAVASLLDRMRLRLQ